ncbi:hypothetical protein G7085_20950 [Tessaracoccus sp. HDW20]|uniref:hypothetical protein n=1 Tax=Tessaracoccus coleopterorum TaxID=2714950 RepID=UPI0018D423B3|nr:hypothetical protein [Tessaracoccus coleopterorum]NHB86152.1 hypothetical protein [Tessaracoccus coleopterorum]
MRGIDRATRYRVGELASSPLDIALAEEIRAVLIAARRTTSTKSGGTGRSRRTTRKEG